MTVSCNNNSYSKQVISELKEQGYIFNQQDDDYLEDLISRHDNLSDLVNVYEFAHTENDYIKGDIWEFSSESAAEDFASSQSCSVENRSCNYGNIYIFSSNPEIFDDLDAIEAGLKK